MPDPTCPRSQSYQNSTLEVLPFFSDLPQKEPTKWGRKAGLGNNLLATCLTAGEAGGLGASGNSQGQGRLWGWWRRVVREQGGPSTTSSLPSSSSSSAWLRPRLPRNTSSASTGNHYRGVTPRAETSQGRAPFPPPLLPPTTSMENKPAAGLASQSLYAWISLWALGHRPTLAPQESISDLGTPPFPTWQSNRYLWGTCCVQSCWVQDSGVNDSPPPKVPGSRSSRVKGKENLCWSGGGER